MIQRIQSIFLLVAGLFFGSEFVFPFATSDIPGISYFADLVYNVQDDIILTILAALGAVICFVNVFFFNNRSLQQKLCYVAIILAIFLPLVAFLLVYNNASNISDNIVIEDGIGAYLPIGAIIFLVLSLRYIRKDQAIVSSMDRLR